MSSNTPDTGPPKPHKIEPFHEVFGKMTENRIILTKDLIKITKNLIRQPSYEVFGQMTEDLIILTKNLMKMTKTSSCIGVISDYQKPLEE